MVHHWLHIRFDTTRQVEAPDQSLADQVGLVLCAILKLRRHWNYIFHLCPADSGLHAPYLRAFLVRLPVQRSLRVPIQKRHGWLALPDRGIPALHWCIRDGSMHGCIPFLERIVDWLKRCLPSSCFGHDCRFCLHCYLPSDSG